MTQRAASRCGDAKAAATAEKLAVASLEAGVRDMRSAYYALSTLAALGRTAPAKALDSALALLQKLKASKGRLRDTPKGAASLTATAHGYLAAAAAQKVGTISSQHMPAVEGLLSGIPQVRLPRYPMPFLLLHAVPAKRGKVRLPTSCKQRLPNPTPCWTGQFQAVHNYSWARCSVFIPPPASQGQTPMQQAIVRDLM